MVDNIVLAAEERAEKLEKALDFAEELLARNPRAILPAVQVRELARIAIAAEKRCEVLREERDKAGSELHALHLRLSERKLFESSPFRKALMDLSKAYENALKRDGDDPYWISADAAFLGTDPASIPMSVLLFQLRRAKDRGFSAYSLRCVAFTAVVAYMTASQLEKRHKDESPDAPETPDQPE